MTENTILHLVDTRLRVVRELSQGKLSVKTGAKLLGITRQGLRKLRKNVREYGSGAVTCRKRGPKTYHRVHNKTPNWIKDTLEKFFKLYGLGADRFCWLLEDCNIYISRTTTYRILVRRRLIIPKQKGKRKPVKHPTSNGKVERLHRIIEEECFWKVQAHR